MQGICHLSVLMPALAKNAILRDRVMKNLDEQIEAAANRGFHVELLVDIDNGERTIGEKRNQLLQRARGLFSCFVDDDDDVSPHPGSFVLHMGLVLVCATNSKRHPGNARCGCHPTKWRFVSGWNLHAALLSFTGTQTILGR